MDYCLDAGNGTAAIWTGPAEADIDGDGLFDDALADLDGDGFADQVALDLDDDGVAEALYGDDGSGTWALPGAGPTRSPRWFGLDGVEHAGDGPADVDGDGIADRLMDIDRDGVADRALITGADGRVGTGYVDTDGDGRWDVVLADTDGDGAADSAGRL